METRAPHALIGLFVLAIIGAVFGFVYWLNNAGGLGQREVYRVRFQSTVSGLLTGATVLFNGIRVGEVTALRLDPDKPKEVTAVIAVAAGTPVRADTRVGLDFQGLTGVPVVILEGGSKKLPARTGPDAPPPLLTADPAAGESMTRAARDALMILKKILGENSEPLRETIDNLKKFTTALARNTDRVDGIMKGLERLTGGGPGSEPPVNYDLTPPQAFPSFNKPLPGPIFVPELTTVLLFDTQLIRVRPKGSDDPSFARARWADSLPKLLQARIVQSFENAKFLGLVTKPIDTLTPKYQLLIDLRRFQITTTDKPVADVEFTAKLIQEGGKIVAARVFHVAVPTKVTDAVTAAASLNEAFQKAATELVTWTVATI